MYVEEVVTGEGYVLSNMPLMVFSGGGEEVAIIVMSWRSYNHR